MKTAREAAGTTSRDRATHPAVWSSVLGLGVERENADPEHLNRRPSVKMNTQVLEAAGFPGLDAVDEQADDVT
jgi:hypothetical protein